jgi:hypothetical protein
VETTKRYRCFISYSQADQRLAKRLHRKLESYRIPRNVVADGQRRLGRFFIDQHELAASRGLGPALRGALDESENLLVIASPAAGRSKWVNDEVAYYISRPDHRILCVIVSGVPNAQRSEAECFPLALRHHPESGELGNTQSAEPLAPDLTKENFTRVYPARRRYYRRSI